MLYGLETTANDKKTGGRVKDGRIEDAEIYVGSDKDGQDKKWVCKGTAKVGQLSDNVREETRRGWDGVEHVKKRDMEHIRGKKCRGWNCLVGERGREVTNYAQKAKLKPSDLLFFVHGGKGLLESSIWFPGRWQDMRSVLLFSFFLYMRFDLLRIEQSDFFSLINTIKCGDGTKF